MIIFKFQNKKDLMVAVKSLNKASKEIGSQHFEAYSYQPDDLTITISENSAPVIESWFKKNNITGYHLSRGYGKFSVANYIRYIVAYSGQCRNLRVHTPDEGFCYTGCPHIIDKNSGQRSEVNKGAICPFSPDDWDTAKQLCDCYNY